MRRAILAALALCLWAYGAAAADRHHAATPSPAAYAGPGSPDGVVLGAAARAARAAAAPMRSAAKIIRRAIAAVSIAPAAIVEKVTEAARAIGVPPDIAHAVARVESDYDQAMRGSHGEVGAMQVLPATARAMGEDPYSVDGSIRAGMKYLKLALESSPDLCAAISGYNHGIHGRPYCTGYGRKVLAIARRAP